MTEKREEARAPVGRFAPTPSGRLHLGNLLCALLAYLSAKSRGGRFLLRIEDLDALRCPRRSAEDAMRDLERLGIFWEGEVLFQSERAEIYVEFFQKLRKAANVYPCFCSRASLHAAEAPHLSDGGVLYPGTCRNMTAEQIAEAGRHRSPAMRIEAPDEEIAFEDKIYGPIRQNLARECGDFILRRSDGVFAYQLAVAVDDALSGVTEVLRGCDLLSSTPRQIWLARLLGFPEPEYCHIPLLCDGEGRRLSKREGDCLSAYLPRFSPRELVGALAFAAGVTEEYAPASPEELIPLYRPEKIRREIRLPAFLG